MSVKRFLLTVLFVIALSAFFSVGALAAEAHLAELTGEGVRFRSEPNLNCTELGRFSKGTRVLVTDLVQNGEWYEVIHNYRVGYVSAQYIQLQADQDLNIGDGITTGNGVNVRSQPGTQYESYMKLTRNTRVKVVGVQDGWYKVLADGQNGYMHADYLDVVAPKQQHPQAQDQPPAATEEEDHEGDGDQDDESYVETDVVSSETAGGIRDDIVALAKTYKGTPYRYGSMNPAKGFDCSGFTTFIFKQFGYTIGRSSRDQYNNGKKVERSALQVGDLVLFRDTRINKGVASHVGIYIGGGQFIHASSRGGGVRIDSLNEKYYNGTYTGGRNIIG